MKLIDWILVKPILKAEALAALQSDIAEMIYEYCHGSTLESPDDLARVVVRRFKERLSTPTPGAE